MCSLLRSPRAGHAALLFLAGTLGACGDAPAESHAQATEAVVADACGGAHGIAHVGYAEVRAVAEVESRAPATLYLALGVDDAAIAAKVPGYDGAQERAFACVPLRPGPYGTGPRFRRVDLSYQESIGHDGRSIDVHRTGLPVASDFATPSWSWNRGVYFGLETPAGIVWAQWPGDDLVVRPLDGRSPTARPLP
jgi:hypothetical protein